MKVEIQGDLCVASGENWKYEQIGNQKVFTQTGKVPSLRVIKAAIKLINSISIPTHSHNINTAYNYGDGAISCGGGGGSWAGCYNSDGSPYAFDPYNGPVFGKVIKENNHVGYMFES